MAHRATCVKVDGLRVERWWPNRVGALVHVEGSVALLPDEPMVVFACGDLVVGGVDRLVVVNHVPEVWVCGTGEALAFATRAPVGVEHVNRRLSVRSVPAGGAAWMVRGVQGLDLGQTNVVESLAGLVVQLVGSEPVPVASLPGLLDFPAGCRSEVRQAAHSIAADPRRDWSLDALARLVHKSGDHLSRLCREATGSGLQTLASRIRAQLLKEFLQHDTVSLRQAMRGAGFRNPDQARRAFVAEFGMSPVRYLAALRTAPAAA